MVTTKSSREIEYMRVAGKVVALAHKAISEIIKPGITSRQIDAKVEEVILENGCTPSFKGLYDFPAASCISINSVLVHGIPNDTVLKNGDIVSVDIGACYHGYHGDSAWTYAVGEISDEAKALMKATEESLYEGLKKAVVGNRLTDISNTIGNYVHDKGYSIPQEYAGHGIGTSVHEDPTVPNFGPAGHGILLKEGMTLAIEPMVNEGRPQTKVMNDGWTVKTKDGKLSAHFEHTVVIRKESCEILTTLNNQEEH